MTCGRTVAAAIIGRAQVRAALEHLAGNPDLWLAGVVARSLGSAARVFRDAARLRGIGFVPPRPPVGGPFPHVADHVVGAVAVRRKRHHRRRALMAVGCKVFMRENALPGVRHASAARRELIAPGELRAIEAAARRELPLGLARQLLTGPFGIGLGIAISDVNDRMVLEPADRAARPIRPAPVGAELEIPPLAPVAQVNCLLGWREYQRAGF